MIFGMNYLGGNFMPHRGDFDSFNPSDESCIGKFPKSSASEVDLAVLSARAAFAGWKSMSRIARAECILNLCRILEKSKDYFARIISMETGKSLNESMAEVVESLHMAQYCFGRGREPFGEIVASELAERDSYVITKPKGVVAVVAPWNFPFAIGGFWCAGPALLEGNTVVFKPSELTPAVGQLTAELYKDAGFPPGVFNMIHGDGETGSLLVSHREVNHIAFTGSVEVGRSIKRVCAESEKTCGCEMGSKSAVMVFEDGDLGLAVSSCLNSAFKLSGQRCVSSGRLLVQRSVLSRFKSMFLDEVKRIHVGDPFSTIPTSASLSFGPLISAEQKSRVMEFNELVRNDSSCTVLFDPPVTHSAGYFLNPFVYECEWADKPFLKHEVFGPHVAIVPFEDLDHAVKIYNDTPYGLAMGAVTDDFRKMRFIRDNCDAGMIYFNLGSIGAESHLPFTGVKMSGYGGSSAAGMFEAVVDRVAVSVNHAKGLNFPQGLK